MINKINAKSIRVLNNASRKIDTDNINVSNDIIVNGNTTVHNTRIIGTLTTKNKINNISKKDIGYNIGIITSGSPNESGVINAGIASLCQGYELSFVSTRGDSLIDGNQKNFMGFYPDALNNNNYNPIVKQGDHVIMTGLSTETDALNNNNYNPIVKQGDHVIMTGLSTETNNSNAVNKGGIVMCPWDANAGGLRMDNEGNVTINGSFDVVGEITATSYVTSSDYRIKNNITTLDKSYNIDNLRPVVYDNIQNGKKEIGFIAHELQENYLILVNGKKDGNELQSVNYNGIIGILVNEVKNLKIKLNELEEKLN